MSKNTSKSNAVAEMSDDEFGLRLLEIRERNRTARFIVGVCAAAWVCSKVISAYVQVSTAPQPSWYNLVALIVSTLAATCGPTFYMVYNLRGAVKINAGRTAKLELEFDPKRSTSRLSPDGVHPNDK